VLAGKHQTPLLLEKTREDSKFGLALRQPWARLDVPRVEMALPEAGMVPSSRCSEGRGLAGNAAGAGWQGRVDLAGVASGTVGDSQRGGLMHSGGGFGLGKGLIPFSFLSV